MNVFNKIKQLLKRNDPLDLFPIGFWLICILMNLICILVLICGDS